ncbi:MAG: prephenate dehydrogenase/arogenate dehydrogenase family protein [Candidatus Nitrosocaldus sp.]
MKITIIGAGGRMGSWFARYFYMRGHRLYINDIDVDALQALSSSILLSKDTVGGGREGEEGERITVINSSLLNDVKGKSNRISSTTAIITDTYTILNNSDLIMLSLPMDMMPKAIYRVARYMHRGSILVEISSLKHDVHRALKDAVEQYGVKPLSLHPLFGPGADINASNRFVLIPVIDGGEEESIAKETFPNATLIKVDDADEHDRAMALVLGMVYAMNIAFADLLECKDIALCKELAGSTFTLQSLIFEGILNDDPRLFSSLLMNRHVKRYLKRFIAGNEHLLACIDARDRDALERLYRKVKHKIAACTDIEGSYRLMYKVLKGMSSSRDEG